MSTQETNQGDATSVPESAPACGGYACCVPTDADFSNPTCPMEEGCGEGESNGCTGTPTSGGDLLQRMMSGMVAEMEAPSAQRQTRYKQKPKRRVEIRSESRAR